MLPGRNKFRFGYVSGHEGSSIVTTGREQPSAHSHAISTARLAVTLRLTAIAPMAICAPEPMAKKGSTTLLGARLALHHSRPRSLEYTRAQKSDSALRSGL